MRRSIPKPDCKLLSIPTRPIKLIHVVSNFMNINGTTLFLFSLSPQVSAGPQKPHALTASKTMYEKLGQ